MEGHLNLMDVVREYYRIHFGGSTADIEADVSELDYSRSTVSFHDVTTSKKKVKEDLRTENDQLAEVEQKACVKINMNKGFVFDNLDILQISAQLPEQFLRAQETFNSLEGTIYFPMAGKMKVTYSNSLPVTSGKQVLKEHLTEIPVTIDTVFTGFIRVGRYSISMTDVIAWKRQQLQSHYVIASNTSSMARSNASANVAEHYPSNDTFRSFGKCSLFRRHLTSRDDDSD